MPFADFHKHGRFQPLAILPLLVLMTAFILSFLCVFAGHKPGFMDNYPIFTLNVTRMGQNLIQELDGKILSLDFNMSDIMKRSEPELVPTTVTLAPTTMITMAPRDIDDLVGEATSKFGEVKSNVGGKITSVQSAVESKATSVAGMVATKVSEAFEAAQTAVVKAVNETYDDFMDELDLSGFYAIHLLTTCSGEYAWPNGTNLTVGMSGYPTNNTIQRIDNCDSNSFINPVSLVRVLYEIGIFFTGCALLTAILGLVRFSRKVALLNMLVTLPALCFIGIASAATHGISAGAAGLVNFVGKGIGIAGYAGGKFMALTWATTILLLVNMGLWAILCFIGERNFFARKERQSKEEAGSARDASLDGHEMTVRHPHIENFLNAHKGQH
ncbi:hypothetical protein PRZ48_006343 [Zasmidium cellare]|uniref:Uncharacterized protein n=1 Tax=Zasmidium cellare TaxID=395010 RepID=A0ABR0ENS6_ZASCE|nr:hypothetical protein PRZ48_006343 [Zasmidium cellare]